MLTISINQEPASETVTPKSLKRSSITVPDGPKRKKKVNASFINGRGRDIRRNLFRDADWSQIEEYKSIKWAILRIDTIKTAQSHRCIRRFYIGDHDGTLYYEAEFYPCKPYYKLTEAYKNQFIGEASRGHRLLFNPIQEVPCCSFAVPKMGEFIKHAGIEMLLFNEPADGYNLKVYQSICKKLKINGRNIQSTSPILWKNQDPYWYENDNQTQNETIGDGDFFGPPIGGDLPDGPPIANSEIEGENLPWDEPINIMARR